MTKKKALIVCPGRGTYNKAELGYLARHHSARSGLVESIDAYRIAQGQTPVSELDGRSAYSLSIHTRGDNASPLIFACSYADFLAIDRDRFDIVAVTGNSMGWYSALVCGGALSPEQGTSVVNTMGTFMQEALIGGQVIYTEVDENWQTIPGRRAELIAAMEAVNAKDGAEVYISIELGGMIVFAGNEAGLKAFAKMAPEGPGRFPMGLHNHAGFHSPLQDPISARGKSALPADWFCPPSIPMIDGRGAIWQPHMSDPNTLWEYTLGAQVVAPYSFTDAIKVSMREFGPDCIIILGPGETLGGAVAQSLIKLNWHGLDSKERFIAAQDQDPFVLSMGREDQRRAVTGEVASPAVRKAG